MKRLHWVVGGSTLAALLAVSLPPPASSHSSPEDAQFEHALQFAQQQLQRATSYLSTSQHARSTNADGTWASVKASHWTSGFFSGTLWFMYEKTGQGSWKTRAAAQTKSLKGQQNNAEDHDIGFRIGCSYGNGYRLTGTTAYRDVILTAAKTLSTRFNSTVGAIRSGSARQVGGYGAALPAEYVDWHVIIDNMMTIELLFLGSQLGGNPTYHNMAVSHALRTMADHVRPDGSTWQYVEYDPNTGAVLWKGTQQGYNHNSTWSRGQAWGIYGFTMSYRYSGDGRFLTTARQMADYYLAHLPADHVPYWDLDLPSTDDQPRDSSAAAITASALLELADHVRSLADREKNEDLMMSADRYRTAAISILMSLSSPSYLAEGTIYHSTLLHGVGNANRNIEVDVGLIYSDYYFIEALLRYKRPAVVTLDSRPGATPNVLFRDPSQWQAALSRIRGPA